MKLKNDDGTWRLPRSLETQAMDFAIGRIRIHQRKPAWNLKSYPEGILFGNHFQDPCQIYGCTFFCPLQGLSNQICLSFRMADHRPTGRIKKNLTSPIQTCKTWTIQNNFTTSPTQNSQRHLFPEIIPPFTEKNQKKKLGFPVRESCRLGAVFPRPGDKLSLHLMVGKKRCGLPTPSGKKQRLHEDCGFTMLERKRGSKKFKASARPGVIGGELVAQLLHETWVWGVLSTPLLWLLHPPFYVWFSAVRLQKCERIQDQCFESFFGIPCLSVQDPMFDKHAGAHGTVHPYPPETICWHLA